MGGVRWFRGRIMGRNSDNTYDILYKDGDREQRVKEPLIRPWEGAATSPHSSPKRSLRVTATNRAATRRALHNSQTRLKNNHYSSPISKTLSRHNSPRRSPHHSSPHTKHRSPRRNSRTSPSHRLSQTSTSSPSRRAVSPVRSGKAASALQRRAMEAFGRSVSQLKLKFEISDLTDVKSVQKADFVKALRSVAPGKVAYNCTGSATPYFAFNHADHQY